MISNLSDVECRAWMLGNNRQALSARLRDCRRMFGKELEESFERGRFEFEKKRLVSRCGLYALQWSIRDRPDEPIADDNPQPPRGWVKLVKLP